MFRITSPRKSVSASTLFGISHPVTHRNPVTHRTGVHSLWTPVRCVTGFRCVTGCEIPNSVLAETDFRGDVMRNMLLFPLLALALAIPSASRSEDGAGAVHM